jgi:hypothetical protein
VTRVLAVVALFSLATPARAQDACAEGRVRTAGLCCWPGQTFSTVSRRCEGTPHCPRGLAEHGAACVAVTDAPMIEDRSGAVIPPGYEPAASIEASPSSERPRARVMVGWPATRESRSPSRAIAVHGRDETLIIVALAIYDAGFSLGWLGALVDELAQPCGHSCMSWPYAFVPLVGGAAAVTANTTSGFRNDAVAFPLGMLSACLQGVGLVAAAVAVENRTTEHSYRPLPPSDFTFTFVPSAPGALAGLSIHGTY